MTGVQADVAEAEEKALDIIYKMPINRERLKYVLQEKREAINHLAWELAKHTNFDDNSLRWCDKVLMARERETELRCLDDLVEICDGAVTVERRYVPADAFTAGYDRIEIYVDGFELP